MMMATAFANFMMNNDGVCRIGQTWKEIIKALEQECFAQGRRSSEFSYCTFDLNWQLGF